MENGKRKREEEKGEIKEENEKKSELWMWKSRKSCNEVSKEYILPFDFEVSRALIEICYIRKHYPNEVLRDGINIWNKIAEVASKEGMVDAIKYLYWSNKIPVHDADIVRLQGYVTIRLIEIAYLHEQYRILEYLLVTILPRFPRECTYTSWDFRRLVFMLISDKTLVSKEEEEETSNVKQKAKVKCLKLMLKELNFFRLIEKEFEKNMDMQDNIETEYVHYIRLFQLFNEVYGYKNLSRMTFSCEKGKLYHCIIHNHHFDYVEYMIQEGIIMFQEDALKTFIIRCLAPPDAIGFCWNREKRNNDDDEYIFLKRRLRLFQNCVQTLFSQEPYSLSMSSMFSKIFLYSNDSFYTKLLQQRPDTVDIAIRIVGAKVTYNQFFGNVYDMNNESFKCGCDRHIAIIEQNMPHGIKWLKTEEHFTY